jgi:hypothetical protein
MNDMASLFSPGSVIQGEHYRDRTSYVSTR